MTKVSPFLKFNGQCAEAIELYKNALKAEVTYKSTFAQASKNGGFQLTDESQKDWIYHAQIKVGRQTLMLCDTNDDKVGNGTKQRKSEVCLCAEFDTPEEVKAIFDIMSEGATIIEPFSSATYSESFVFLEDKFGVRWWLMTAE